MFRFFEARSTRDRRNVWNALASYPNYEPPFRGRKISGERAEVNYNYFMETRSARILKLKEFFLNFSISVDFNTSSISEIGSWLFRYGGHLLPKRSSGDEISALTVYDPDWLDELQGLNVINDLGTFVGEYIVTKNERTRWGLYKGYNGMPSQKPMNYNHPCIFGLDVLTSTAPFDPVYEIYDACSAGWFRIKGDNSGISPWDKPDHFQTKLQRLTDINYVLTTSFRSALDGKFDLTEDDIEDMDT